MKCMILAGGSGNRLWPLSRNNYPKQFINITENHSLFQETIVRNMPFCDEFIIVTNKKFNFIVEGQLHMFQGLKYRCVFEDEARKTSASILLTSMLYNPSELILVVPADHIIDSGADYRAAIMDAQALAKEGSIVAFGLKPDKIHTGYGYILHQNSNVLSFHEKPEFETAKQYIESGDALWNSGLYMFYAGDLLQQFRVYNPDFYNICCSCRKEIIRKGYEVIFPQEMLDKVPAKNIEYTLMERSHDLKVVEARFHWHYINELEALCGNVPDDDQQNVIRNNCQDTTVINQASGRLVVANSIDDAVIVNTPDATYVSKKGSAFQIKQLIRENVEKYQPYFDDNTLMYRSWGTYEVLKASSRYKVKKVTVFPGKALTLHRHNHRSEHWAVVQGTATIQLDGATHHYGLNDCIDVPVGILHQVSNDGDENLVIIETSVGEFLTESDIESQISSIAPSHESFDLIKLDPAFQDYLWGGTRLRDEFHKNCDYDIIAESWELSAHPDGNSVVAEGPYRGMFFSDYLSMLGEEALGWKCKSFEKFPLLIKFIDAQKSLSIQVHPDDDYALKNEDEYGKNEMWYVCECEDDSALYYGFRQDVTKEEIRQKVADNTLLDVLNRVPVSKGDVFFVNAGTVHAIGAGILICEIQQNSNCTYRLYDYGRTDKYGNQRELHLDKALDVLHTQAVDPLKTSPLAPYEENGALCQPLGSCKYFECLKYTVPQETTITVDETTFVSLVFLSGTGQLTAESTGTALPYHPADSFFAPARLGPIHITGPCTFILTHI